MEKSVMRKHMEERFGGKSNFSMNPPLPNSLNIELNSGCNQKCIFCPFHGEYAKKTPKITSMKEDDAKRLLIEAKKCGIGTKEVGFYLAGEVLLYHNFFEIVSFAKKLGFKYTFITTNGVLATENVIKPIIDAGLDSIRFSINAADSLTYRAIHGTDGFESVVNNIKWIHNYVVKNNISLATSISCVITKRTLGIEEKIREIFSDYVDDIIFIPVMLSRLKDDINLIEEYQLINDKQVALNKEYICPMLFNTMYINADLKVMPCCEAYDDEAFFFDLKKEFDLVKAWNCDNYRKYRGIFLEQASDDNTICANCDLRKTGLKRLFI